MVLAGRSNPTYLLLFSGYFALIPTDYLMMNTKIKSIQQYDDDDDDDDNLNHPLLYLFVSIA